jgi:hypothetical protein
MKVGTCSFCGHWGLLWGKWCKAPFQNKAGARKAHWRRWVHAKNKVADPLPDTDWIELNLQAGGYHYGRKRKVHGL